MSTRRERLERKLEKRGEWAGKARQRSSAAFAAAHERASVIPFGQPILIGHHSERRDRRYRERIRAGFDKAAAESQLVKHHEQKAAGLESALERSIFDDDPDAIERLEAKAAELEASRETMKAANKAWKRGGHAAVIELLGAEVAAKAHWRASYTADERPYPSYALTNTGAEIRRCKQRIEAIRKRRALAERAEKAGGVVVVRHEGHDWCKVTFADKPDRSVLVALRAAGYGWAKGSWSGTLSKLPEEVERAEEEAKAAAGECLCVPADHYECAQHEAEREKREPESFAALEWRIDAEEIVRIV